MEPEFHITESGTRTMLQELGIRTQLDLRSASEVEEHINVLGNSVTHTFFGAPLYTDIFLEENRENVRKIFSALADPNIYPTYLHCTYGLDRTGTVCAVLEALLGVEEENIRRDYFPSVKIRKSVIFPWVFLDWERQMCYTEV